MSGQRCRFGEARKSPKLSRRDRYEAEQVFVARRILSGEDAQGAACVLLVEWARLFLRRVGGEEPE